MLHKSLDGFFNPKICARNLKNLKQENKGYLVYINAFTHIHTHCVSNSDYQLQKSVLEYSQ